MAESLRSFFRNLSRGSTGPCPGSVRPCGVSEIVGTRLSGPRTLSSIRGVVSGILTLVSGSSEVCRCHGRVCSSFVTCGGNAFGLCSCPGLTPGIGRPDGFAGPTRGRGISTRAGPIISRISSNLSLVNRRVSVSNERFIISSIDGNCMSVTSRAFTGNLNFPVFHERAIRFMERCLPARGRRVVPARGAGRRARRDR